ncbi:unnamed protein product [Rotaria sp. Silwood1]|nr:unnamed protein product [Rotaria sp. Silwood1]CAF4756497.1 unnamed protein product [Rotaria sp. Silwood1]
MAHVHFGYRGYPVRSPLAYCPVLHHVPIHHQSSVGNRHDVPRHLPVLHAPTYPGEYNFYEGEEEEQELYNYSPVVMPDQHRRSTYYSIMRAPTFMSLQNYYKRSSHRYFRPKHSSYIYY